MLVNFLIVVVLLVVIYLGIRVTIKTSWIRKAVLKWPVMLFSGLITLIFFAAAALILVGYAKLNLSPYRYPARDVKIDITPERVSRGEKMAHICADCHSSAGQPPLDGSRTNILAGGLPLGELYASNLTPGGPLKDWTDAEILRALREGVDNRDRPLVVMPSGALHYASDEDIYALVAYLRSQPAVENDLPDRSMSPLAALMVGAGMFPTSAQTPILEPIVAPSLGTEEYGAYLAASLGCGDCHGPDLAGMEPGAGPGGPNLTAIVPLWQESQFIRLFREGLDPSGRKVDDGMPWDNYGQALDDAALKDLYRYLSGLQRIEKSSE